MVSTVIQTFDGNVGIGTKNPDSNKLKVYGGTSNVGALTVSSVTVLSNVSSSVPSGLIIMWYGAYNAIPSGWKLCDGTSSTPNLSSNLVLGWGTLNVGSSGGAENFAFNSGQIPTHNHGLQFTQNGSHAHTFNAADTHTHGASTATDFGHVIFGYHGHNVNSLNHSHSTETVNHTHRNAIYDTRYGSNLYDVQTTYLSWTNHGNVSYSGFLSRTTRAGGQHNHGPTSNNSSYVGNHQHNCPYGAWDHNHTFAAQTHAGHSHTLTNANAIQHTHTPVSSGVHTHQMSMQNTGNSATFNVLPAYRALVFIMKI